MYQSKHKGKKIDSAIDKVPVLEEELNQTASRVQNMENGIADNKSRINEIEASKGQPNGYASLNSEGNIFLEQIADGAITTSKIGKNAVGTDNIKDAAVDSAKIVNGSIAARHIMDEQVTRDKIAADSISSDKIANKSVTTEKINDGAVTTEKIADGEISETKLDAILSDKINRKANKSDLTADNIQSVYSSKLQPHKLVNKPDFPEMTGASLFADIAGVIDIGGVYVPEYTIDYVWKQQHQNIAPTTYYVSYDMGSSSATGLHPFEALRYPSDAMTKAGSGDTIIIMDGYFPRNQLGFDQNKSVRIRGGIFCNADNNRSLTWTLVEGTTYKTTRSQAFSVYQAEYDFSTFEASELLPTPTLKICKSTRGSYFIDGDTVYVNTPGGYNNAPGYDILISLNAVGATINTNVWCENTVFVFGGQAACLNRSRTDPALFSNCIFKYAKQNGFMSQGGKSYLLNCESYNNGRDGFSYKKLNSNVSYGFEVGCTAHHNGDNESTGSDNGSTAHEGSIVTRINGKYYENKGPNIADVNPGTMSYNLNCACSNSTATAQDRRIDFNIEDGTMYLDRCTSDGSFISLYEASVTMPQRTKSYNLGSVLPGVYRVKNVNGVAENLSGGEDIANKVKSISSSSTDVQYPSAKAVNDVVSAQKSAAAQNFANAIKGKASGENAVRIDDTSPVEHEMSVRVSSKNLIPYPFLSPAGSLNGVTWTYTDDGFVILNGTCAKEINLHLAKNINVKPGAYTLSDSNGNGTTTSFYIQAFYGSTFSQAVLDKAVTFNLPTGQTITRVTLYIKTGATLDNVVIKPQLERGTVATEYTPYVDPTSVTLTQRGKNLIPYRRKGRSDNGITYTVNDDGSVTANGTAKNIVSQYFHASGNAYNVPNGIVYTFSDPTSDGETTYQSRGQIVNSDGVGGFSFTCTAAKPYYTWSGKQVATIHTGVYLKSQVTGGQSVSNVKFYPQFEVGDTATEYEAPLPEATYIPSADGTITGIKSIYPTTTFLSNKDNVVIDVEYNRDINNPDVFEDYVKFTDYASSDKSGVIKFDPWYGLNIFPSGVLYVNNANIQQIADRDNAYKPIVPTTINATVKAALSDAKRISDMTDKEKTNARGVIGAAAQTELEKKANSDSVYTKEESDQNFANALKGKVSGNNAVRIDDSSPIEHEMNVRVSSKNLIPYPYAFFEGKPTYTESGLTLTDNGDGTITANGTLTKNTSFKLYQNITLNYQGIVIQSYKGLINNGYVYVHDVTDNITHMGGVSFELYFDHRYSSSVVIIAGEYDNVTFKPQLERGNVITDYTPYIAPSSVTLSEIGKNLIPYPYAQTTKTVNGITFTDNGDGSITIDGTATANASFTFSDNLPINLSGIYTLSKNVPDVYLYVAYYKNNSYLGEKGVSAGATSVLVDLTTIDCDRARSSVQIKSGTTINKAILKPQLELGSTKTDYEKYVPRKTFTPSADGTVTGVNNIYPTTSLLSNKDNVVIDVEYNRDLNKAFEELQNAILAQGSNT